MQQAAAQGLVKQPAATKPTKGPANAAAFALIYGSGRGRVSQQDATRRQQSTPPVHSLQFDGAQQPSYGWPEVLSTATEQHVDFTIYALPPKAPTSLLRSKGAHVRLTATMLRTLSNQKSGTSADDPHWITTWVLETESARADIMTQGGQGMNEGKLEVQSKLLAACRSGEEAKKRESQV